MLKNGHLGLGTTSPVNPLGVNGGVAVGQGYAGSSVAPSNGMIVEGSVGIGTSTPMNSLDAAGGVAVGGSYSGSQTAPADGAIIEGAVGIGTSSPIDELHVENGAVLFRGNTGSTSASGVGTRFMWVPDKSAIRAGIAGASGWDAASIGSASAAFGNATTASGTGSVAMGYGTEASGDQSTALGYTTTASGSSSFSAGLSTSATGDYAAAFGTTSDATGESSFAQGDDADATKDHAIAMGEDVDATGVGAVAIGKDVEAAGDNSIAIGVGLKTPGYRSVAVGSYNVEPTGTSATSWGNGDKPLFTVGASQTPNLRQNGFVVQKNGNTGIGLQVATDDINNDLEVYGGAVIGKNHSKGSLAAPTDGLLVEGLVEIGDNGNTVGFSLLDVYGSARSPRWGSFSDARMKSNIEGIENALVRVRRMRAVSYDLRSGIDASSRSLGRQMGFIAQELAEIEPSLVDIGEDGVYSVYYGNVTALLAQAISEMDEKLDAIAPNTMRVEEAAVERSDVSDSLRLVVSEQESRIQALEEFVASLVADQSVDARRSRLGSTSSILYQNRPNPFSDETTIGCFVPETASSARIEVTQVGSGVVVRRVPVIGRGDVEIVVSSHGLSSGSYSYSLIVDGIEVDTRLMEITR